MLIPDLVGILAIDLQPRIEPVPYQAGKALDVVVRRAVRNTKPCIDPQQVAQVNADFDRDTAGKEVLAGRNRLSEQPVRISGKSGHCVERILLSTRPVSLERPIGAHPVHEAQGMERTAEIDELGQEGIPVKVNHFVGDRDYPDVADMIAAL
jgi:hypothetical protein